MTVVVVSAVDHCAHLKQALTDLRAPVTVLPCARIEKLRALIRTQTIGLLVSDLRDATGASTLQSLLAFRSTEDATPLIVAVGLTSTGMRDVVRAIEAGLEANWVIRDAENLPAVITRVIAQTMYFGAANSMLKGLWPTISPQTRQFFALAAIGAVQPTNTLVATQILGLSERTLEKRLERSRLPSPRRVLGWCRVLQASWYLDKMGLTPKQVAAQLTFPSVPALYNLFHRHRAPRPAVLLSQGGFDELLRRFVAEVSGDAHMPSYPDNSSLVTADRSYWRSVLRPG